MEIRDEVHYEDLDQVERVLRRSLDRIADVSTHELRAIAEIFPLLASEMRHEGMTELSVSEFADVAAYFEAAAGVALDVGGRIDGVRAVIS